MTRNLERPVARPNQLRENPNHLRKEGGTVLSAARVNRPGERLSPVAERLTGAVKQAVKGRIHDVRELHKSNGGGELPLTIGLTRQAYLAQDARVRALSQSGEITSRQLNDERVAKAVLMGPTASEALKSPRYHKNKLALAEHNDVIRDVVETTPPQYLPDTISVISAESKDLGRGAGQPDSRITEAYLRQVVQGARAEIAVEAAIKSDPTLKVVVPDDAKDDLKGIDLIATSRTTGQSANADVKGGGAYIGRIKELLNMQDGDRLELSGTDFRYYFVGMHENGYPHYLINADAGEFGDIDTSRNQFGEAGQVRVRQTIHEILGE